MAARQLSIVVETNEGPALAGEMDATQVVVTELSTGVQFVVRVPAESVAEAIAAELRALGRDSMLVAAIGAANARLTSAA